MTKRQKQFERPDIFSEISTRLGVGLMAATTALASLQLGDHSKVPVVLTNKPILVQQEENSGTNSISRERDQTAVDYVSYNQAERTPSRSGMI